MKVAVLTNCVPFVRGGTEILADALTQRLEEHGHEASLIRIPFRWDPPSTILDQILACRLLRVPNVDRVIALKFPAYFVPHANKCLWLLHQFRQAYDLWGTEFQHLPNSPEGRQIRESIIAADNCFLKEAKRIYTNSHVTAARLMRFNGLPAEVLYPPLLDENSFRCDSYGDYIFSPGRINRAKRQYLLVEAMQYCSTEVRLIVAGKAEEPLESESLRSFIVRHNLSDRVVFMDRFISEEEKIDLFANALACAYIPYDEDSYGYVTLEAFLAQKAVLTCSDSGGVKDFVLQGMGGVVAEATPRALAKAIDEMFLKKQQTQQQGAQARAFADSLDINWTRVVTTLLS